VVADDLFARVLGDGWHVAARFSGQALVGRSYQRPFGLIDIPDAHIVVPGSFVTTEDGTGLVHLAPAFGADDMNASRAHGLPVVNPIRRTAVEEACRWSAGCFSRRPTGG